MALATASTRWVSSACSSDRWRDRGRRRYGSTRDAVIRRKRREPTRRRPYSAAGQTTTSAEVNDTAAEAARRVRPTARHSARADSAETAGDGARRRAVQGRWRSWALLPWRPTSCVKRWTQRHAHVTRSGAIRPATTAMSTVVTVYGTGDSGVELKTRPTGAPLTSLTPPRARLQGADLAI